MTPRFASEDPASAGSFRVPRVLALVLAVSALIAVPACRVGHDRAKSDGGLDKDKSVKAKPLDPTETSVTTPGTTSSTSSRSGTTATTKRGTATTGTSASATPTTAPAPFRTLTDVADKTNDEGLQGTAYGDIVELKVEDNGTRARVTVAVAADFPAPPPADETISVPVDFFRGGKESDFQLFAQWNGADWRAYYTAGTTQKQFPGTFELGANKLVFDVPWSALGGRVAGTVSAEADWSKQGTVVAPASEDHAPDQGSAPFAF